MTPWPVGFLCLQAKHIWVDLRNQASSSLCRCHFLQEVQTGNPVLSPRGALQPGLSSMHETCDSVLENAPGTMLL